MNLTITETEETPPVNTEIINTIINPAKTADRNNVDIGDIIHVHCYIPKFTNSTTDRHRLYRPNPNRSYFHSK